MVIDFLNFVLFNRTKLRFTWKVKKTTRQATYSTRQRQFPVIPSNGDNYVHRTNLLLQNHEPGEILHVNVSAFLHIPREIAGEQLKKPTRKIGSLLKTLPCSANVILKIDKKTATDRMYIDERSVNRSKRVKVDAILKPQIYPVTFTTLRSTKNDQIIPCHTTAQYIIYCAVVWHGLIVTYIYIIYMYVTIRPCKMICCEG